MTTAPKRPPQSRTGLTDTGVKKAADKSARTRAREFALQALYQYLVGGNQADAITPDQVKAVRSANSKRLMFYNVDELLKEHPFKKP